MDQNGLGTTSSSPAAVFSAPVRAWFEETFRQGVTPAQELAWLAIASGENILLISPTGTGKTLAAFLAILDRIFRAESEKTLAKGVRCVYVSPLRSLNYDIERNLRLPLEGICRQIGRVDCPVRVGVRTGDTPAHERRSLRDHPPHILITTPESLSLLLSQESWQPLWSGVDHVIVDEVHALAPTKRGADLAVSLERLAACCARDPIRVGLSATCAAGESAVRFLAGRSRSCRVVTAPPPRGTPPIRIDVETLIEPGEAPHRGLSYRRLLKRLRKSILGNRTTVIFANTRAFAEKLTHDLRQDPQLSAGPEPVVVAHHSALDAQRRREIESALREGKIRAVITSTSLELGIDIGTADLTIQIGSPGGVARCLQRVGRAGHRRGAQARGLLLAATPAELAGAAITAQVARAGQVEPLAMVRAPLDVLCQQLIGMSCGGDQCASAAFELIRNAGPMAELSRADFDACLDFLAGKLATPPGAIEPEAGAPPRWTSPRLWSRDGQFGLRSRRVARLFWNNVGTINSEETVRVIERGVAIGTLEAAYAERLVPGDRFVLDGRALEFRRLERSTLFVRATSGEPSLPRWTSMRQSLSFELARELARFRTEAGDRLVNDGPLALHSWLARVLQLDDRACGVLVELFEAQIQWSEIPSESELLVESSPSPTGSGLIFTFHAPLHRAACEALGRAASARLGRQVGRDLTLSVADLGWSIHMSDDVDSSFSLESIRSVLSMEGFADLVLEGIDRGELPARRFRHVAATALMVLRNPESGRRVRVGGLNWVSTRLYPMIKSACPDHPLVRETRREVLEDILDVPAATRWLAAQPRIRFRKLPELSPFAAAWIEPGGADVLRFEPAGEALRRLHSRLVGGRNLAKLE
jgi:ATP-dependent helicase Lhr and Lhr-like helicase